MLMTPVTVILAGLCTDATDDIDAYDTNDVNVSRYYTDATDDIGAYDTSDRTFRAPVKAASLSAGLCTDATDDIDAYDRLHWRDKHCPACV